MSTTTEIKVHVRLQGGQHLSHANIDRIVAFSRGRRYRLFYRNAREAKIEKRTDRAGYFFWEDVPGGCGMCGTHDTIRSLVICAVAECGARVVLEDVPAA